jgi:hypothetical protein
MRTTTANLGSIVNVVDLYNGATGTWSTAQLSLARNYLAATSVGNLAVFAGGLASSALLCRDGVRWGSDGGDGCVCVECLRVLQHCGSVCPATACSLTRVTAGGSPSNVVDLYNGATGAWSTAQLSVERCLLAAASVGNFAIFAGGDASGSALLCSKRGCY